MTHFGTRTWTLLLLAMLVATACDGNGDAPGDWSSAAPGRSSVRIESVSPSVEQALIAGEDVSLEVKVAYTLDAASGTLALVVQGANNSPIAQELDVVSQGAGTTTFTAQFVVPDTRAIQIFTPLSAQGQTGTTTVDARAFKVERR